MKNVGVDTILDCQGVALQYLDSKPINYMVNSNAKLFGTDRIGTNVAPEFKASIFQGGTFADSGKFVPANIAYVKSLYLEPQNSSGGNYIQITASNLPPWQENNAGILPGSLHYNTTIKQWYKRTMTKPSAGDTQACWTLLSDVIADSTGNPVRIVNFTEKTIPVGGSYSIDFTVDGANIGDFCTIAAPYSLKGLNVSSYVSAKNTVTIQVTSTVAYPYTLLNGPWKVKISK